MQSNKSDIGYPSGLKAYINTKVGNAKTEAILSCWGPVQIACGMISPKKSTQVTEIMTAI